MDDWLVWTSGATSDLQTIYTSLQEPVGEELLGEIDAVLSLLKQFPRQARIYGGNIRRILLGKGNLYGLFYSIEGRRVVIAAVLDLRQDPNRIQALLKSRTNC